MSARKDQIKAMAEADLESFIRLVHPKRVLGSVHRQLLKWWTRRDHNSHQITLLPRDHQKSALSAYRVAWVITNNPAIRILYVSSTTTLAIKQLKFIKDILTSPQYKFYWPDMLHPDEGKREKWSETEFSVDHIKRKEENVRDSTVFAAGLTTSITGLHCDVAVLDDVVVYENAYTQDGRDKVQRQYSFLASIEGTDAEEWVVGTRYDPRDLYNDLINKELNVYDENGDVVSHKKLYEVYQAEVENIGDGSGEFLWPRQQRSDGVWFGFNRDILERKRAQYINITQFRAQYYNNPNSLEEATINRELFQYYEPQHLSRVNGRWFFKAIRLNIFAAIDFAFSLTRKADYTSIVVIGIDADHHIYILEIARFKTGKISEYFAQILALHQKWDFRKIRAEVTVAQEVIVNDLKDNYIKLHGLALSIDKYRPSRYDGSKAERIEATLQPRYENQQIWHYMGGYCQTLEEELVLQRPPHDDVKDALASVIGIAVAPSAGSQSKFKTREMAVELTNSRFGGYLS